MTCPRQPSSRSVRWLAVTLGSLKGDRRTGRTARSAGGASRPGAGLFGRHRYRPRRHATDCGRGQSQEVEKRGFLRQSLRSVARGSLLWKGSAPPPQPRWQPGRQPSALHDLSGSYETGSSHQGVRRQTHCRGQEQARDHPLPQALRRKGGLPRASFLWRLFLAEKAMRRGQPLLLRAAPLDYRSPTL
jgi:hypothetical protein